MVHQVIIYPAGEENSIVLDFYKKLNTSARRKIVKVLKYIEEYGLSRDISDIKKSRGYGFWEVRILGKDNIRLFAVELDRIIYVLHIFHKKTESTPLKDLNLTKARLSNLKKELDT
jgi:phage-related protein